MADIDGYGGDEFASEKGKYHDRMIGHHDARQKEQDKTPTNPPGAKTLGHAHFVTQGATLHNVHEIAKEAHGFARDAHETAHHEGSEDDESADSLSRIANHISDTVGVSDAKPKKKSPSVRGEIESAIKSSEE